MKPKFLTRMLLITLILTACSSNSLSGKWVYDEEATGYTDSGSTIEGMLGSMLGSMTCISYSPIEFLKNNKIMVGGMAGSYKIIDKERIEIDLGAQGSWIASYKLEDEKLHMIFTLPLLGDVYCAYSKSN